VLESLRIATSFTDAVLNELPEMPDRSRLRHDLALVSSEALTNALRHSECAEMPVRLAYSFDSGGIVITVTDHGVGFDPDAVPLPNFEEGSEGGYGIYIMKTIMDDMLYEKTADGNNLILTKSWVLA
ncbi:MAG: ATP-binding protein, partial [Deltaproteobacteria bacterium]